MRITGDLFVPTPTPRNRGAGVLDLGPVSGVQADNVSLEMAWRLCASVVRYERWRCEGDYLAVWEG